MKKLNKFNADKLLIIICTVLVIPIGLGLYFYFKDDLKINDENGYNSIDSVVGILSLVLSIITVISIFITYQSQQKQIRDNNKDVEFNRVLDLFYKQIGYSEKRLIVNKKLAEEINRFYKGIYIQTKDLDIEYTNEGIQLLSSYLKVITHIRRDLEVYHRILISSNLSDDKKKFIVDISIENIYPDLRIITKNFYKLLMEFKLSGTYRNCEIEQNNESILVIDIVENIEDNLKKINAILFMKPFEEI